jgi:hypothetical protein
VPLENMQIWKASSTQSSKIFNSKTQWIFMLSPNKQMVFKQKTLVMGMCEDQTTNATTNANLEHLCDIETFLSWSNLHSRIN